MKFYQSKSIFEHSLKKTVIIVLILIGVNSEWAKGQKISPMLVGNNAWFTNPSDQVWALTGECGVTTIRIGGNAFNDNMPSNATLVGWIKKIRGIGAEPIVQISQKITPSAAAAIVTYLNFGTNGEIEPVKFWNIGNEPWLEANRPPTSEVGALVEAYFKPLAAAMKEADPTIKIYGPDFAYYIEDALDDLFGGKNDIAGKIPGKEYYYVDGLSWHRYPQDDNINLAIQGIEDFKTSIVKCKTKVDAINAQYNRTGDEALQWGIGEYNAKNGSVVHTWENGQMFGGVLGLCMKYEATYAATWSMFENGGSRTGSDYSFIDGANMTPRSSYRHMQFVAQHFTGNYLDGTTTDSNIFIYGAQDGGKTSVMIMNRESGVPLQYTLHLNSNATTGDNVVLNVNGNLQTQYSDIIGQRTTQVLIFQGDSIVKINYTSDHFDQELPPVQNTLAEVTQLPEAPSLLDGLSPKFDQIDLAWTDNSSNESGFIIEQKINSNYTIVGLAEANSPEYVITGLSAATPYEFRVTAYNSLGTSDYSNTITITTANAPEQATFNGPHTIPGKLEVEDFNSGGQGISYNDLEAENRGGQYRIGEWVDLETCTEGGYNIGYVTDGEWINYTIGTVEPGEYSIAIRLASNSTVTDAKKITLTLDNQILGSVVPTSTGGWQNWNTYNFNDVSLPGGTNQLLKLAFGGSGYNINWLEFTPKTTVGPLSNKDLLLIDSYYSPLDHTIHVQLKEIADQVFISIHDLSGRRIKTIKREHFQSENFTVTNFPEGIYIINVASERIHLNKKLFIY